jgi:Inositol 1,3,4-trisphosphate 5/6-kinase pre-ATP-grasp domain
MHFQNPDCGDVGGPAGAAVALPTAEVVSVGYAFMPKKMESMEKIVAQQDGHEQHQQVHFQPLDLNSELASQGRFDVILHKLSEDIMQRQVHATNVCVICA